LQLVGFIFLVFGTLVYNEILIIPFLGFNLYTREALAKTSHAATDNRGLLDNTESFENTPSNNIDYIAQSPHTGYDANRLKRNIQHHTDDLVNKTHDVEHEIEIEEKEQKGGYWEWYLSILSLSIKYSISNLIYKNTKNKFFFKIASNHILCNFLN